MVDSWQPFCALHAGDHVLHVLQRGIASACRRIGIADLHHGVAIAFFGDGMRWSSASMLAWSRRESAGRRKACAEHASARGLRQQQDGN
jgi:hypothetical protein